MQIAKLDHVNIITTQLDIMINWYADVLGLHKGYRPNFGFPGAWLYAGDTAIVHLVTADEPAVGSELILKLEHFALSATGSKNEFEEKLKAMGIKFRSSTVDEVSLVQVNVHDPDGNHIHVDFPADR